MSHFIRRFALPLVAGLSLVAPVRAEFLFASDDLPVLAKFNYFDENGDLDPEYLSWQAQFADWDVFYSPHTSPNYPDVTAPHGGIFNSSTGRWEPVQASDAGFPTGAPGDALRPYNPGNPLAFWDTRNPTITQTGTNTAFIIGPDSSGNIYSFSEKTKFVLADSTADADSPYDAKMVMFSFHTDGAMVDFSTIKLRYTDAGGTHEIAPTEYLREFLGSSATDPSAVNAFRNRVALQWDLSAFNITDYEIVWQASSSSMSFQSARLDTADQYDAGAGMPGSRTWTASSGDWSDGANWSQGTSSVENGNVRFGNAAPAAVTLDGNRTIGEMIFETAADVTITPSSGQRILSNTGLSTTAAATGIYTINSGWEFGATNLFELAAGTVRLNGPVTGGYGLLKKGGGTLVIGGTASFTDGITLWGGTLRLEGANTYGGGTSVITGRLEIAADNALGSSSTAVNVGADGELFETVGGGDAAVFIDGDHTVAKNIKLAAGDFQKQLGAFDTTNGAAFSGNVDFGAASGTTATNVRLTAVSASDRVAFSGAMTGGKTTDTLAIDGSGTLVLSGPGAKSFAHATTISGGVLEIASGATFTGSGDWQVESGAKLRVNGAFNGTGALGLDGGTLTGGGTVSQNLTIDDGDRIAPGENVGSLTLEGTQTWAAGGGYEWQIASATGAGADFLQINGTLDLEMNSEGQFTLYVNTVTMDGFAGALADFDGAQEYQWLLATASDGIDGFSTGGFTVDLAGFQNTATGVFTVELDGDSLFLTYSPVPEPGVYGLLLLGAGIFLARRRYLKRGAILR